MYSEFNGGLQIFYLKDAIRFIVILLFNCYDNRPRNIIGFNSTDLYIFTVRFRCCCLCICVR